jgi:hypothetical protein
MDATTTTDIPFSTANMPRCLHTTYAMMSRAGGGQFPPPPSPPPSPPPPEFDVDPEMVDNEAWEEEA